MKLIKPYKYIIMIILFVLLGACAKTSDSVMSDKGKTKDEQIFDFVFYDHIYPDDYCILSPISADSMCLTIINGTDHSKTDSIIKVHSKPVITPFVYFSNINNSTIDYPFQKFDGIMIFSRNLSTDEKFNTDSIEILLNKPKKIAGSGVVVTC